MIIVAFIPTAAIGFGFDITVIGDFYSEMHLVGPCLIFTGILVWLSKDYDGDIDIDDFPIKNTFLIGIFQGLAILPGISRSGITISTGLLLGMNAKDTARFSFLLAIPAISGAGLITAIDMLDQPVLISFNIMFAALASSFVVGYLSLKWFLRILENGKLHFFGFYCIAIGLIILLGI